jgi:predicted house-cleaning NTP pyrophosphatase (Maf/HAM1 superfamily)
MADLAKTSTDKWQKADAEKAVVSFDERIAQVKAGMQAKANQEAKAKAEAERNAAQIAKLQAEQAESRRIEEEKAKAVKNSTKEDRIIIGKGELNKSSDKAIAKKLNISDDAMKKLLEFRDKKRRQSFESVLIIDEDGKTILEKDGEQYNVSFSQDEVNKIEKYRSDTGKKIILTHNHPRGLEREDSDIRSWGNSFSEDDIRLAKTLNLSTIIATTPKQTFYMSSDEWPSDITIKKISNSIRKRFMDAISKAYNEETVQWADALHHHSIYTTLLSMKKMKKTTYWAEADI